MKDELVDEDIDPQLLICSILLAKFLKDRCVVSLKWSVQDHVNRCSFHLTLEAFLNNIRGELKLAQPDEVSSYHRKYLVVSACVVQLEHVLDKIVSEGILNQAV